MRTFLVRTSVVTAIAMAMSGIAVAEECITDERFHVYSELSDEARIVYDFIPTDVIFLARTMTVRPKERGEEALFEVRSVLRGNVPANVTISRTSSSDYSFKPGKYYLVKAVTLPEKFGLAVYLCGGTFEVPLKRVGSLSKKLSRLATLMQPAK